MWLCFFRLASSHHHLDMNFYCIILLLLVVLSAYSESPQYGKPLDPLSTAATVCPNSSSDSLGVLAPVLPQSEVYKYYLLSQNEMFGSVQSQNMVLPQNEVYKFLVLPQNGVFDIVTVNCQLANKVKAIINFVLNSQVKSFKFLTSTLIHGGKKTGLVN